MTQEIQAGSVVAVSRARGHRFSKPNEMSIRLIEGLGVEGDAHMGVTVQHSYHMRKDPLAPNLRQVHLMHVELFDELAKAGFIVKAGELGENITTRGLALLDLPTGARLRIGAAVVEITGLRSPCSQIDKFQQGLMGRLIDKSQPRVQMKSGVMGVVIAGGDIAPGDAISVDLPPEPHRPLEKV
jgi:MOSC domain-containing protein YiiM